MARISSLEAGDTILQFYPSQGVKVKKRVVKVGHKERIAVCQPHDFYGKGHLTWVPFGCIIEINGHPVKK